MSDMIERDKAIGAFAEYERDSTAPIDYRKVLMAVPSVQPETAKRIVGCARNGMTMWYQCDMCHEPVDEKDAFCRGCGRRLVDE